jgi:hypothetical protein
MKLLNQLKAWWERRKLEQKGLVVVHFKLPSGRTFDVHCVDPKARPKDKST